MFVEKIYTVFEYKDSIMDRKGTIQMKMPILQ